MATNTAPDRSRRSAVRARVRALRRNTLSALALTSKHLRVVLWHCYFGYQLTAKQWRAVTSRHAESVTELVELTCQRTEPI